MCPFYNAQLFEITGAAKGVFTRSQSSCHIAKVVLTIRHDSRQIPIASDARPFHTSRGFLHWRFAYAGPTVRAAPPSWGRHPRRLQDGTGRLGLEAARSRLSWRPMHALDQGQEPGVAGDESRGGYRLVAVTERSTIASETVALTFDTSETAVTALWAV